MILSQSHISRTDLCVFSWFSFFRLFDIKPHISVNLYYCKSFYRLSLSLRAQLSFTVSDSPVTCWLRPDWFHLALINLVYKSWLFHRVRFLSGLSLVYVLPLCFVLFGFVCLSWRTSLDGDSNSFSFKLRQPAPPPVSAAGPEAPETGGQGLDSMMFMIQTELPGPRARQPPGR